jgi:hypothetical protein
MLKPTFNSDFEAVYLRHDYLKRIDPSKVDMKEYNKFLKISTITGKMMYEKYKFNFNKVSFSEDDVVCVANVYLYSYLGLYSIRSNPGTKTNKCYLDNYRQKYGRYPSEEEIEHRERNTLINFLRQKLQHYSTLCSRKARNIVIGKDIRIAVAETKDSQNVSQGALHSEYKKFGYRKITAKELKEAKQIAMENKAENLFDKFGYKIIEIDMPYDGITLDDFNQIFYSNKMDEYTNSPEQLLCNLEEEVETSSFKQKFDSLSKNRKRRLLLHFINKNKNDPEYKKELTTARKMLNLK